MIDDNLDERIKRLRKMIDTPDSLPTDGGYTIELVLREPDRIFRRGKVLTHAGLIGTGEQMLRIYREMKVHIDEVHDNRRKGDWTI